MSMDCNTYSHGNSCSNYLFQTSLDQLKRSVTKTALYHPSNPAWLHLLLSMRAASPGFRCDPEGSFSFSVGWFSIQGWKSRPQFPREPNASGSHIRVSWCVPRYGPKRGKKTGLGRGLPFISTCFSFETNVVLAWDTKSNNQNIFVGGKSL